LSSPRRYPAIRIATLAALVLLLAGCNLERRLSEDFLHPTVDEIATPAAIGIPYEDVHVDVDDGITLHGWFLPNPEAHGRTIVLCHGNRANISYLHPYYGFLRDAGFQVFLFDYRGWGRSGGEPSVGALLDDLEVVVASLREREDVGRIAYYGLSLGSILALRAAADDGDSCAGVLVENAIHPGLVLRQQAGSLGACFVETFVLPGGFDVEESAAELECPVLLIEGERDGSVGFAGHLAVFANAPVTRRAMWVLPNTGHAPHSLLVWDGHYQTTVVEFLRGCFDGAVARLETSFDPDAPRRVSVHRRGTSDLSRWAVQLCAITENDQPRFFEVWHQGEMETYDLPLDSPPRFVAATRCHDVVEVEPWRPRQSALARAGLIWDNLEYDVRQLFDSPADWSLAEAIATRILVNEEHGPFHPLLQARLVPVYGALGRALWSHDRQNARFWLERCVDAAPERPELAYWPGQPYVARFTAQAEVDEAKRLLESEVDP